MSNSSSSFLGLGLCRQTGALPGAAGQVHARVTPMAVLKIWEESCMARVTLLHPGTPGQVQDLQLGSLSHWCQEKGTGETGLFISFVCRALST